MTNRLARLARRVRRSPFADDVRAAWDAACLTVGAIAVCLVLILVLVGLMTAPELIRFLITR